MNYVNEKNISIFFILLFTIIFVGFSLFLFIVSSESCWGTRPLSMGGAFTGLADNADSVYWNPAGLSFINKPEISFMSTTHYQDLNYDQYFGLAFKNIGIAYVHNKDIVARWNNQYLVANTYRQTDWFHLCFATNVTKRLSVGITGKVLQTYFKTKISKNIYNQLILTPEYDNFTDLDFAFLYVVGNFRLGCLIQDYFRNGFDFKYPTGTGSKIRYTRNIRPGISYKFHNTILSCEIYDANTEYYDKSQLRLGIEQYIPVTKNSGMFLRAGGYHINNSELRAATFGGGIKIINLEINSTIIYWTKRNIFSTLFGLNFSF